MCVCVCACVESYALPPCSFLPGISGLSLSQSRISEQEEQECDWLDSIAALHTQRTKASLLYREGVPKYCVELIFHGTCTYVHRYIAIYLCFLVFSFDWTGLDYWTVRTCAPTATCVIIIQMESSPDTTNFGGRRC